MKPLLYSLAFLFSLAANAQAPKYYMHQGNDSIAVYPFSVGGGDTSVKVSFKVINEATFTKYKKAYKPQFDKDSTKVTWGDTTFVVKTNSKSYTFKYRQKNGLFESTMYYYLGYLKPLNLFALLGLSGTDPVAWLTLINKTTGKYYTVESNFDGAPAVPLVSPDGNTVLVWACDGIEEYGCSISLHKVNKGKDGIVLTNFWYTASDPIADSDYPESVAKADSDRVLWDFPEPEVPDSIRYADGYIEPPNIAYSKWLIEDVVWSSNTSFAFKIYRVYFDYKPENRVYTRTPFKYVLGSFK